MAHAWTLGVALVSAACRTATPSAPPPSSEVTVTPFRDPYDLATTVLEACRAGAVEQFPVLETQAHRVTWRPEDRIRGLYFQADGTREIAAVVRLAEPPEPAVWLTLRRVDGGFVVTGVVQQAQNPSMDVEVEGI